LSTLVGAATAGFSAALVAAPQLLIRPGGLEDSRDTRTLTRVLGVRDTVLGVLMVAAPDARTRRLLTVARVVCDGSDAVLFGSRVAGRPAHVRVAASAATWAGMCVLADVLDARAGR
jgi:hypothetical protein